MNQEMFGSKSLFPKRWSAGGVFVFCFFFGVFDFPFQISVTSTAVFEISSPKMASPCQFQRVHDCSLAQFDVWLIQNNHPKDGPLNLCVCFFGDFLRILPGYITMKKLPFTIICLELFPTTKQAKSKRKRIHVCSCTQ